MKKTLVALALLALPVAAQTITPCSDPAVVCTGTITSSANGGDAVQLWNAWGSQWSTIRFKVVTAGTATATLQTTSDGVNWVPAPYARRVTTVTANPTTQAITATTLTTGDVWEVATPGNNYGVQILCAGAGTTTTISIYGSQRYREGVPVFAVLADVTETGTGAGIPATVFDWSGWQTITVYINSPTTQVFTVRTIDDAGPGLPNAEAWNGTAATGAVASFVRSGAHLAINGITALSNGQIVAAMVTERRLSVTLPAGGTVSTGRYRVTVSR